MKKCVNGAKKTKPRRYVMSVSTEYYSMVSIELNVELWTSIIDERVDYSSVEPVLNTYFWKSDLMSDAEIRRVEKKKPNRSPKRIHKMHRAEQKVNKSPCSIVKRSTGALETCVSAYQCITLIKYAFYKSSPWNNGRVQLAIIVLCDIIYYIVHV